MDLNNDIKKINKIGTATAKKLNKLGIKTIYDLLFYFPFRYDIFDKVTPIKNLNPENKTCVVAQIELIQNKRSPRKKMNITEALLNDGTEKLRAVWFNQPFIARLLKVGDTVSLAGKVDMDFSGYIMTSPIYEKIGKTNAIHTQGIVPNYHLTSNLTQKQIRFLINNIIHLASKLEDWLPREIKNELNLLSLGQAIQKIHFPLDKNDIKKARERLAFDELFLIQMQAQLVRTQLDKYQAPSIPFAEKEIKKFVSSLPFKLTDGQRQAAWEIIQDMNKSKPMMRLLEGDVGSGKTMVAIIAMLNAVLGQKNAQTALMVPTEILAYQHYQSISSFLKNFNINIALFSRTEKRLNTKNKKIPKKQMLEIIKTAQAQIIIGTHALIQENLEFHNLILAIVDEQHRFGVEQRKNLLKKACQNQSKNFMPHMLSMTATPIPRSLALALYGDLDISIIKEMPRGRKKIITRIVTEEKRPLAYNFIKQEIKKGRQAFVICPLIDPSDRLGVKSVKEEYKKLNEKIFPDLNIGILHGRLSAREKEKIMQNFLNKKIDILVSTSVVEVGVDVPNATIMIIEGAERFGLPQLHQFRGRVGRGEHQSYCLLFTESQNEKTKQRLSSLVSCYDGFSLAKIDLKFRGPGEVYGTAQKGFPDLKIASLFDYELIKKARAQAIKLIKKDPTLKAYPQLKEKLNIS